MTQPYREPCAEKVIGAQPCPREEGREIPPAQRRWVLTASIIASSMAFIDGSALTVALPALKADLGADLSAVQWVLNGYILALAALTLVGGALADVNGKARMLIIGCAGFGVASIACALAPTSSVLIAARVAQGVAAAILTPSSLALIGAVYPKDERNRAIGTWAAASALTTAGGPVLGGWLTETFGWQAVFWINPPLAAAAIATLLLFAPEDKKIQRRFDWPGAGLMAMTLAALAWALSEIGPGESAGGETGGNSAAAMIAAAVSIIGLCAYLTWERRTDHPMIEPHLFRNRTFAGLNVSTLFVYAALSIMFFLMPFELVDRRGMTATEAGMAFLPFTLGVGFLSSQFGGLADRVGARILLVAGATAAAFSYIALIVFRSGHFAVGVLAPMALLGVAFAVLIAPLTASVMSSVSDRDEGMASGINNTASRIAQLIGVALAAGLAAFASGYELGLWLAAVCSVIGAAIAGMTMPSAANGVRD